MSVLIAVPSTHPGGLDAPMEPHFGHCDVYTLVEVEDGSIKGSRLVPNVSHQRGGCMAPVNLLSQQGVKVLISGGMGMRPLQGFTQLGIQVFRDGRSRTVADAVRAFIDGRLVQFGVESVCRGGGHCSHGH